MKEINDIFNIYTVEQWENNGVALKCGQLVDEKLVNRLIKNSYTRHNSHKYIQIGGPYPTENGQYLYCTFAHIDENIYVYLGFLPGIESRDRKIE